MTDQPDIIDLGATSFKPKEGFKPIQGASLFNPKPEKKPRGVPGGDWADSDDKPAVSKPQPSFTPTSTSFHPSKPAPVEEKTDGFIFIKKKAAKANEPRNPLALPSLSEIRSESYVFERKLIQDIIQPYGATRKPPESMLSSFAENCRNLEGPVIVAIFFYLLEDTNTKDISKYRGLCALEYLLKNKKFFDAVKFNLDQLKSIEFDSEGADQLLKLKKTIVDRTSRNFEDAEVKPANFDLSKLENLKEKSNAKFFEKMDNLKKGGSKPKDEDFFEASTAPAQTNKKQTDDDLFSLDATVTSKPKPAFNEDILGLALKAANDIHQKPETKSAPKPTDDLFDFSVDTTKPTVKPSNDFDNILFDTGIAKPKVVTESKGLDDISGAFDLAMNIRAETKPETKQQSKDPFDFLI